jgi:hypothetical protein
MRFTIYCQAEHTVVGQFFANAALFSGPEALTLWDCSDHSASPRGWDFVDRTARRYSRDPKEQATINEP